MQLLNAKIVRTKVSTRDLLFICVEYSKYQSRAELPQTENECLLTHVPEHAAKPKAVAWGNKVKGIAMLWSKDGPSCPYEKWVASSSWINRIYPNSCKQSKM